MEPSQGETASSSVARREVLLFELNQQRYALPLSGVLELTRACAVQALPSAPMPVLGVLNLRGQVVPVIDLRRRLALPDTALDPNDYFVFARVGPRLVGLRVDRLLGIQELDATPTADPPHLPATLAYVSGVAAVADGVILIYDLDQFLSGAESAALDSALSTAREQAGDLT